MPQTFSFSGNKAATAGLLVAWIRTQAGFTAHYDAGEDELVIIKIDGTAFAPTLIQTEVTNTLAPTPDNSGDPSTVSFDVSAFSNTAGVRWLLSGSGLTRTELFDTNRDTTAENLRDWVDGQGG